MTKQKHSKVKQYCKQTQTISYKIKRHREAFRRETSTLKTLGKKGVEEKILILFIVSAPSENNAWYTEKEIRGDERESEIKLERSIR